jgi:lipopolysaccharide biosynthesis glycosyltransferase
VLGKLQYHDQDALNLLCGWTGGWLELDHKWNVQVGLSVLPVTQ